MRRNTYLLAVIALLLTFSVEAIAQPLQRTLGSRRLRLDDNLGRSIDIDIFDRTISIGAAGTNALPNSAIFYVDGIGATGVLPGLATPRGVLFAPMSTGQRNSILSPTNGLLIYNTTTNQYEYWNGASSQWVGGWALAGNVTAPGGTALNQNFIGSINNVDFVIATNTGPIPTAGGQGERIRVTSTGNVGISATGLPFTPLALFHVGGTVPSTSGNAVSNVRLNSLGGNPQTSPALVLATDGIVLANNTGDLKKYDAATVVGTVAWLRTGNTIIDGNTIFGTLNDFAVDMRTNNVNVMTLGNSVTGNNVGIKTAPTATWALTVGSVGTGSILTLGNEQVNGTFTSAGNSTVGTNAGTTNTFGNGGAGTINTIGNSATTNTFGNGATTNNFGNGTAAVATTNNIGNPLIFGSTVTTNIGRPVAGATAVTNIGDLVGGASAFNVLAITNINTTQNAATTIGSLTNTSPVTISSNNLNGIVLDVAATTNNLVFNNIATGLITNDLLWINAANQVRRQSASGTANEGLMFENGAYRLGATPDGTNPIITSRFVRVGPAGTLTFNNAAGAAGNLLTLNNSGSNTITLGNATSTNIYNGATNTITANAAGGNTISATTGANSITGQTGNTMTATSGNNALSAPGGANTLNAVTNSITASGAGAFGNTITAASGTNTLSSLTGVITTTGGDLTVTVPGAASGNDLRFIGIDPAVSLTTDRLLFLNGTNDVRTRTFTALADEGVVYENGAFRLGGNALNVNPITSNRIVTIATATGTLGFQNTAGNNLLGFAPGTNTVTMGTAGIGANTITSNNNTITGPTNVNTTGAALTTIGNAGSTVTLQGGTNNMNGTNNLTGPTNINTTGTAATTIGAAGGSTSINSLVASATDLFFLSAPTVSGGLVSTRTLAGLVTGSQGVEVTTIGAARDAHFASTNTSVPFTSTRFINMDANNLQFTRNAGLNNVMVLTGGATGQVDITAPTNINTSAYALTRVGNTTAAQQLRVEGVADAIVGNTLAGNPAVWDLVVVGDEVVTGITKFGGSIWIDGNSATHSITSSAALNIVTTAGNLTLTSAGTINFGSNIGSNIIPALPSATYNLGSTTNRWNEVYATSIFTNTLTLPTGTFPTGSVIFANATGQLSSNDAKFHWDNTNFRLGIGNNVPAFALDVTGGARVTTTLTSAGNTTLATGAGTTNTFGSGGGATNNDFGVFATGNNFGGASTTNSFGGSSSTNNFGIPTFVLTMNNNFGLGFAGATVNNNIGSTTGTVTNTILGTTNINNAVGAPNTVIGNIGAGATTVTINAGTTGNVVLGGIAADNTATSLLGLVGGNVRTRTVASLGIASGAEPFLTFAADAGSLSNNRVLGNGSGTTVTIVAGDGSAASVGLGGALTSAATVTGAFDVAFNLGANTFSTTGNTTLATAAGTTNSFGNGGGATTNTIGSNATAATTATTTIGQASAGTANVNIGGGAGTSSTVIAAGTAGGTVSINGLTASATDAFIHSTSTATGGVVSTRALSGLVTGSQGVQVGVVSGVADAHLAALNTDVPFTSNRFINVAGFALNITQVAGATLASFSGTTVAITGALSSTGNTNLGTSAGTNNNMGNAGGATMNAIGNTAASNQFGNGATVNQIGNSATNNEIGNAVATTTNSIGNTTGVAAVVTNNIGQAILGGTATNNIGSSGTVTNTILGTTNINVTGTAVTKIGNTTGNTRIGSAVAPTSTLHVDGSFAGAIRAGGATALTATDYVYINTGGASVIITLPSAVGITGRIYVIKNNSTSTLTAVTPSAGQTIDGVAGAYVMNPANNAIQLISDGANWFIISTN